jgi:type I restriction enzyme, S subunit
MYQPQTITKSEMSPNGAYPVFGANGVMGKYHSFNHEHSQLLIGCRGACGTVHLTGQPAWITGNSMVVRPRRGETILDFLRYFFLGPAKLEHTITGAAQPQITQASLRTVIVPLPPLEEQRRIVAILDEAFEGLARARTHIEANLQNARELFDAALTAMFTDPPTEWTPATLASKCRRITVGHVGPMAKRYADTGVIFLRSQNVRPFRIDLTDVKYIDEEFVAELKKSELRPGDVAIVRTGYPGVCAVIPDTIPLANCADLVIARTGPDLSPHFLAMLLNSSFGKKHVAHVSVGAAQQHFNVSAAKAAVFPIPPIQEQMRLIERSSEIRQQTSDLELGFSRKLQSIDALHQSLLQKAFAGELT